MTNLNPTIQKIIKRHLKEKGELPSTDQVTKELEKKHSHLIEEYMKNHRHALLQGTVTRVMVNERNKLRKSELTKRLVDGTADAVFDLERFWATAYFVPGEGWKQLGELTGKDHEAIADRYEVAAVAMEARAELHRDLAEKVGSKTTRSVFKPQQLINQIRIAYDTQAQLAGG